MRFVAFGLTVSPTWGNGHATLCAVSPPRSPARPRVRPSPRRKPWYAAHRDLDVLPGGTLHLYPCLSDERARIEAVLSDADVAIVTSYCPDAVVASALVLDSQRG